MVDTDDGTESAGAMAVPKEAEASESDLEARAAQGEEAIEKLITILLNDDGTINLSDPEKVLETYRKIEYQALTQGKGKVMTTYTAAMIWLGYESLPKALDRAKHRLDGRVGQYKAIAKTIKGEMMEVSKKKVDLLTQRDQSFHLDDLLTNQITTETSLIAAKEEKIRGIQQQGVYDENNEAQLSRLRAEIEELHMQVEDYDQRVAENAQNGSRIMAEIESSERQYASLRDRLYSNLNDMYDTMKRQSPTLYLIGNIKHLKELRELSAAVERIGGEIGRYKHAGDAVTELYEATLFGQSRGSTLPDSSVDSALAAKRDQGRERLLQQRQDMVDQFRSYKRQSQSPAETANQNKQNVA